MTTFHFEGLPWSLRIESTPLREAARRFFALWPHRLSDEKADGRVESLPGGGYCWRCGDRVVRESSAAAFLCSLSIEMAQACCAARPGLLRLHSAAVAGRGRGLLLCGRHHAGKSVLTARLIADGWTGFGDDMAALTPESRLLSLGIAPRLRLPLPPSRALRSFAALRRGCRDDEAMYLDAARSGTAAWGEEHDLHAVVVLRRRASGTARLRALSASDGVAALLARTLFEGGEAGAMLEIACGLMRRLPCVVLEYADADAAARRLDVWARQGLPRPPELAAAERAALLPGRPAPDGEAAEPSSRLWRRAGDAVFRQVGLEGYLADARGAALYRLNPLGCAVWRMLDSPLSEARTVNLLREAFPGTDRNRIARDVRRLFEALRTRRLVLPVCGEARGA